ncbi:MAG: hypothetical protein ACW99U_00765 [Candidatus Thorarchaeota archaeon]
MSTTWFIAKEYLKRLDISFEEKGRKTFSLFPYGPTETEEIEIFPGTNWITLTTRLYDLSAFKSKEKRVACERLLKANAKLVEMNFGIDKKNFIVLRNALPVPGISYDAFNCVYEAHLAGIGFFYKELLPTLE